MATIACVQYKLDVSDFHTSISFRRRIDTLVAQIRDATDDEQLLIALPEHIGTFCVFCDEPARAFQKKGLSQATKVVLRHHLLPIIGRRLQRQVGWMRALALVRGSELRYLYVNTFSTVARKYGAWIVAGSCLLPDEGGTNASNVSNVSYLFGPNGQVYARQKKVFLVEMETAKGFDVVPGTIEELEVVDTPFGCLGLSVCLDGFKKPVCQQLAKLGANVLVQPSANNAAWSDWQQMDWLNGAYQQVIKDRRFDLGINPMLVGTLWDLEFAGQSSIISARPELAQGGQYLSTPMQSGFVQVADTAHTEQILLLEDYAQ